METTNERQTKMIHATNLCVNHLKTPLGIDGADYWCSWLPTGAKRQSAYQVCAYMRGTLIFDSGKVNSGTTHCNLGNSIPSKARVDWTVRLWDENDAPGEVSESWFECGIAKADWHALWIDPELPHNASIRQRASYLRKDFFVPECEKARLYITAHGIYDACINGIHVDGYLLSPGSSQYDKRLQVQAYDITALLRCGENEILVALGDGWYRGCTHNDLDTNTFGTDIALLCQIEANGEVIAVSDESWQASQSGPLGLNDMMMGEEYDARKEITDWHAVTVQDYGYDNLVGTNTVPVTAHDTFSPKIIRTPAGETVLDFGQNISGFVRFSLDAREGQTLILTHGEVLDENGNFTISNFQNPRNPNCHQRIIYICKDGRNEYHPTKCYFGFRYVKVDGDVSVDGSEFTAVAIYSDIPQTGFFECGIPKVNQLFKNALWSMKGNFVDVPTDCPTREKSGYSGDLVTFCHTAMYLMDCWPVLNRWLSEQTATQFEDGAVRQVAPNGRPRGYWDGGAGWCDSMEIVPWRMMRRYADTSAAETHYESIRRWLLFCLERGKITREENQDLPIELQPYFIDQGMHWGEWLEPDNNVMQIMMNIGMHGEPEVATSYLSYGCNAMADMAKALGKKEDAVFFANAAQMARAAYRYRFIPEGNIIESKRQCLYVRPLSMGLLDKSEQQVAADTLAENVKAIGNHLNTGFLSTHELCRVLTDNGHADTAYDLLLQPEYPGWLYPVSKGATTIWENWKGVAEDGTVKDSMNHYSFGSVVGWLFDRVAGIVVEDGSITIRPYPDKRLGYAKAKYLSPLGEIISAWRYEEGQYIYEITIPCNAEAKVILPDGREFNLSAGSYIF